jgi:hypothetical protein
MRKYIAPSSHAVALHAEGMMATSDPTSLKVGSSSQSGGTMLSNRHGWDSDNWSGDADEDIE